MAKDMAELSEEIGRQVGLMIDRSGTIASVIVGDGRGLFLPDMGRQRGALTRLSGLRLVHTHLAGEGLTQDDINDLALLRLDLVAALIVSPDNRPPAVEAAHLLPDNSGDSEVARLKASHAAALDLDFSELFRSLEEEFAFRQKSARKSAGADMTLLVSISSLPKADAEDRLAELEELARTAGLTVQDKMVYRSRNKNSRQVLSRERIHQLNIRALQTGVDLLVFDRNLTSAQVNLLADQTELRIIDRTQLILDIFAQRAQTREGKLQVEMAQLNYLLPRLTLKDSGLSRLTGGIGARGPGETKLEINRRRVRERIARLRKDLEAIKAQRGKHRARRAKAGLPIVSIVGYTNAGKSTLLNNLTKSDVLAENRLFATLDPTSRRLRFPRDRAIIITDTVGFIRDLPPDLVEAFAATLEELSEADLLLHVIDSSNRSLDDNIATVEKQLSDLGLTEKPLLRVLNKTDLIGADNSEILARRLGAVSISALDSSSFPPLIDAISGRLDWS